MRKVKWGVLGCANFAKGVTIPAMLKTDSVELIGAASRSKEKAEAFAQQFGLPRAYGSYEEMLADPEIEAVYNPLPNGLHAEWTMKAVQAGKHCLTEKPFAVNVAQAQQVAEVVKTSGVKVMEAFMWRFHPMHRRARELARNGTIGRPRVLRSAFTFTIARQPNVRLDANLAGGGIMDVGCYCISAARFFFETEPVRAYVRAEFDPEYDVDMMAAGMLEFPEYQYATFDSGFTLPFRCDYELIGEAGRIVCNQAFLPGDKPELHVHASGKTEIETFEPVNQYVLEFDHLCKSIVEGTPLDYDIEDAIKQQKAVDAVLKSMRSGQPEAV